MTSGFKIKDNSTAKKIEILTYIAFGYVSDTELNVLRLIIAYSTHNSMSVDINISSTISSSLKITNSAFNTTLFRLNKRGVIRKQGKLITLSPVYSKIEDMDKLLISFEAAAGSSE